MDANGTRFSLLLGRDDWGACASEEGVVLASAWAADEQGEALGLAWDASRDEVALARKVLLFTRPPGEALPSRANRRGAGTDAYGNWYWVNAEGTRVLVQSSGSRAVSTFWSVGDAVQGPSPQPAGNFGPLAPLPPSPTRLRGLAVTTEHYLVAGVLEPAGLLIFDLHAGGAPRQVAWPLPFAPLDLAEMPNGGVVILDRDLSQPGSRLWELDRQLNVIRRAPPPPSSPVAGAFGPLDGSPPPAPVGPTGVAAARAVNLAAADPVALEGLPDGSVLVLDNGFPQLGTARFSALWRYREGEVLGSPVSTAGLLALIEQRLQPGFGMLGYDLAVVSSPDGAAEGSLGRLLVVAPDGNQCYAFALSQAGSQLQVEALPLYLPMRLFGGMDLVSQGARAFYTSGANWIPLVEQPRARYATEATMLTPLHAGAAAGGGRPAFDGREPGCQWHRLMLDACLPPGTAVDIWSRAADSQADLAGAAWQAEPAPYRRGTGSELPCTPTYGGPNGGTWELLFQGGRGRFLQVKLRLRGDGRASPRLRALRVYAPRFSYLDRYLPAAYREDPPSASFLDRFLANVEGISTALEDRIGAAQLLFDVRTVPGEYLDWLADWFGEVLEPHWEDQRRRLFLAHAPQLFRERGTVPGLLRSIRLATDPAPDASIFDDTPACAAFGGAQTGPRGIRLVEQFRTRTAPGVLFGDPSDPSVLGQTVEGSLWTVAQGVPVLHARYRAAVEAQYATVEALNASWGTAFGSFEAVQLPPVAPQSPAAAADWRRFLSVGLGFPYAPVDASDTAAYQAFLARRYARVETFAGAYRTASPAGFDAIELPERFPRGGTALRDWIEFVSAVAPRVRAAHRFTVLVPTAPNGTERATLPDLVRRVVERAKPAHTVFDVEEYWALFRVGEARLGLDSVVDCGSRLLPLVLGSSVLSQGYLTFAHPWSVPERTTLGAEQTAGKIAV